MHFNYGIFGLNPLSLRTKSNIMHHVDLIRTLKERREVLKVTQEHLAELAGVGLRTLKAIESGKGNPTLETLNKLANVLGMELKLEVRKNDNLNATA